MKKFAFGIIATCMLISFIPTQSKAETEAAKVTSVESKIVVAADENAQFVRLQEIKAMDISSMSRAEKKELRKEVRLIKNDQDGRRGRGHGHHGEGNYYNGNHGGGTVFFIGGSGLLIILLIILLI